MFRPMARSMRLALFFSLVSFEALFIGGQAMAADTLFINGRIVTQDSGAAVVEAMAIAGGRVLATGTTAEILAGHGADSQVVDLGGHMVLPGLIDTHQHTLSAAVSEFDHPIPDMRTIAEVQSYISERAKVVAAGEWIWVRTVFPSRLREHRLPTRAELDAVSPDHPVVFAPSTVSRQVVLNSRALAALGIDAAFAKAHGEDIPVQPDSGEPTGLLRNHKKYLEDVGTPDRTETVEQRTAQYRRMMSIYNSAGLTTVVDRNTFPDVLDFYRDVADQGLATVRIGLYHAIDPSDDMDKIDAEVRRIAAVAETLAEDPWVRLVGIKTFYDGGVLSGTALMLVPWGKSLIHAIEDPHYHGNSFIDPQRLRDVMAATVANGLQFTSHGVGDGAVRDIVEAFADVSERAPVKGSRSSVTHSNFMTPRAIDIMADLDIVADIQPAWFYLDSNALLRQFGYRRLAYFQPLRTLFERGIVVAGGSDHWSKESPYEAVNPFSPFLGMWIAVSRQARYVDEPVHPEQGLTREQALAMYTTNAAFALEREEEIGSLAPGRFADFVVVDRDIFTCGLDELRDTRVLETWLAGERVYGGRSDVGRLTSDAKKDGGGT